MKLSVHRAFWPAKMPFRITGQVWNEFEEVVVALSDDGHIGRGVGIGVYYNNDMPEGIISSVERVRAEVEGGLNRAALQELLPPGGARNALDSALWDLDAKRTGKSIWELAGVAPRKLQTVFTIGLEATPEEMATKAANASRYGLLKVKLSGDKPLERIRAIREARKDVRLVVDANQGWTFEQLRDIAPAFADLGVEMIEQPLPRGEDAALENYRAPLPLCADESCLHLDELDQAADRYQMINIKLDKTGGLTHALELAAAARERDLRLMVGCMCGTSLAMAPAYVLGCLCDLVDIDGPLLQKSDCMPGLTYKDGWVEPFESDLWG